MEILGNAIERLGGGRTVSEIQCMSDGRFRGEDGFYYDINELLCLRVSILMTKFRSFV